MVQKKYGYTTISSNEVKQRWGAVMRAVEEEGEPYVVESYGRPKVAVVKWEDLADFREMAQMVRGRKVETRLKDLDPNEPWPFDDDETMDYAVYITKIDRWARSARSAPGSDE